jgi:hypothetical protein
LVAEFIRMALSRQLPPSGDRTGLNSGCCLAVCIRSPTTPAATGVEKLDQLPVME